MQINTYHADPMPFSCREPAMALRGRFQNGIFVAWQGNGMVCVNQTRSHCVNQMGKTRSQPLAERHGMAWERHGMCESAFNRSRVHTCAGNTALLVVVERMQTSAKD
jgi:hypothetical protein